MISRRLGGPSALSWPAFWVCLVTSIAGNMTDRFTSQSGFNVVLNLAANVAAVAAMFAVMLALRPLLLRDVAVRPRPGRAIVMFVVGASVRGVVLGLLLSLMGTGEPRLLFRVVASIITITLAMSITATIVDLVRTSQARRRMLRAQGDDLRRAEDDALAKAAEIQERATAQVRSLLLDRLSALKGGRVDDLAPGLRADADEVIRPMSHEMVHLSAPTPRAAEPAGVGRIGWADVWNAASLGQPFRPLWGAVLLMVMSLSMLTAYNASLARGLAYAVIGGLLIAGALALLGWLVTPRLRTMSPGARGTALVASGFAGLVAAGIAWGLIMGVAGSENAWRSPISIMIGGLVVVLGLAIEQGFRRQAESADAELAATNARLQYAAAVAGATAWHEERRMSRALHGPVQTAVRAAAMRIEQGDLVGAKELLVQALGHLESSTEGTGVREALAGVAKAWDGLCTVQVALPDDLAARIDDNPALASSVVDICTDACSNAVRHGGAAHVAVQAQPAGDALELVVSDDGAPDGGAGIPGMGSAMLDDVSVQWLRRREDGRTVLRATLPLARERERIEVA